MLQRFETSVSVKGRGQTREAAFADALSGVQRAVMAEGHKVLVRIEPQDIKVVEALELRTTEKFMFFFLPRVRTRYALTLDVTVSVTAIDTSTVTFAPRAAS